MSKGEAKTSDNLNQMNESMEKRCFPWFISIMSVNSRMRRGLNYVISEFPVSPCRGYNETPRPNTNSFTSKRCPRLLRK
jgi:hypothetical protein